jgi:RNA binding exosome subunit
MKSLIQSMEVTYLVHATEDPAKIAMAVARALGIEATPEIETLEGHFGNRILRAKVHLTGDEAEGGFSRLVEAMPRGVVDEVLSEVGAHLDEHSAFYLRLDKQSLVSGSISLGSSDPVRVKVKPRRFLIKGGAPEFYSRLLRGR